MLLKSFAGLSEKSLNKTLSRILESLKKLRLIVKSRYYLRLFNLDESDEGLKELRICARKRRKSRDREIPCENSQRNIKFERNNRQDE